MRARAAPGVNRLVVIAYHGETRALPHQQLHQLVLAGVGVLIFIHQQVADFILPALAHLFIALQQQRGQQDQIVKVQHVARFHMRIVQTVAVGEDPIPFAFGDRRGLGRRHQIVFPVRDRRDQLLQQHFVIFDQPLGELFEQRHLIGVIEEREVGLHSQRRILAFDDIQPQRVEGGDHQAARLFTAQRLADALFHLARRFIGKGDRRNVSRLISTVVDQMGDFVGDHAGFTRTGPCQHQAWSSNEFDRLLLSRV